LRSIDLKKLLAYSPIVHMNLGVLALSTGNNIGLIGAFSGTVSHSSTAAALFLCSGMLYDRIKTRNLLYFSAFNLYKLKYLKNFILFFLFVNMGLPFTSNFYGEILQYISIIEENVIVGILSTFNCFVLSILYNLFLIHKTLQSKSNFIYDIVKYSSDLNDLNFEEILILIILIFCCFPFGFYPSFLVKIFTLNYF